MTQGPLIAAVAQKPSKAVTLLQSDAQGNVSTTSALGYETVAASQTAQVLGVTGAVGDVVDHVVIVPATSAAGIVTLLDGSTSISLFAGGGTTALTDLKPITVNLGMKSTTGPWKITTGANVSVIAVGTFSA